MRRTNVLGAEPLLHGDGQCLQGIQPRAHAPALLGDLATVLQHHHHVPGLGRPLHPQDAVDEVVDVDSPAPHGQGPPHDLGIEHVDPVEGKPVLHVWVVKQPRKLVDVDLAVVADVRLLEERPDALRQGLSRAVHGDYPCLLVLLRLSKRLLDEERADDLHDCKDPHANVEHEEQPVAVTDLLNERPDVAWPTAAKGDLKKGVDALRAAAKDTVRPQAILHAVGLVHDVVVQCLAYDDRPQDLHDQQEEHRPHQRVHARGDGLDQDLQRPQQVQLSERSEGAREPRDAHEPQHPDVLGRVVLAQDEGVQDADRDQHDIEPTPRVLQVSQA
mmetsp:Transcript_84538/g.262520  ORF Transcript_84538/g.262520 Transcript_84538/m.262520 type:complete len:330 (-) Transcript_84538:812-1801(-)